MRRLRAARDDAGLLVLDVDLVAMARDGAVEHLEADQLARHAFLLLPAQHVVADELLLLPADRPAEIGLEHGRRLVDVVAVEPHRRLEPQRVARAEAGGHDAGRFAGVEHRVPDALGRRRRHEHLEAVLAGIAGARDR